MKEKTVKEMVSGSEVIMNESDVLGVVHHATVVLTPDAPDELLMVVKATNSTVVKSGKGSGSKQTLVFTAELPTYLFDDPDTLKVDLACANCYLTVSLPGSTFKTEVQLGADMPHGIVFGQSDKIKRNPAPDIKVKGDT